MAIRRHMDRVAVVVIAIRDARRVVKPMTSRLKRLLAHLAAPYLWELDVDI